jgi:CBS domain-containing protein
VARGKSADLTAVSSVMTPNPESASADLTLLDALKEMHDQKFLHLPVKDEDSGRVVGNFLLFVSLFPLLILY